MLVSTREAHAQAMAEREASLQRFGGEGAQRQRLEKSRKAAALKEQGACAVMQARTRRAEGESEAEKEAIARQKALKSSRELTIQRTWELRRN